jgi:transposase
MFIRKLKCKRGDRTYTYLKLVESVRSKGKILQRTLVNFGNVDFWSKKKTKELIVKLAKVTKVERPPFLGDVNPRKSLNFGQTFALDTIWEKIDLSSLIKMVSEDRKVTFDIACPIKIMIMNRLIEPKSKLGVTDWVKEQYIPDTGDSDIPLQHYYRALDQLIQIKDMLEKAVHQTVTDLFTMNLSMVFYDITSSYFEGDSCTIAKSGYSRDHRPDLKQIEIGLLVNDEGIPISHSVFEGNIKDKNTVLTVLEGMQQTFHIKRCIFVGDSGIISENVFAQLEAAGYEYIASLKRRKSLEANRLMEALPEKKDFQKIKGNLFIKELAQVEKVRFIACYNPIRAAVTKEKRDLRLQESEDYLKRFSLPRNKQGQSKKPQKVHSQIERVLRKKGTLKFFKYEYRGNTDFTYSLREDILAQEEKLDGHLILKTNAASLSPADIATGYRTLSEVEDAFNQIKNFIRVRPIRHYVDPRVRGHVFVCVLAYLIEKLLEKVLRENNMPMTTEKALTVLSPIKLVVNELMGQSVRKTTYVTKEQREIFKALGVEKVPSVV